MQTQRVRDVFVHDWEQARDGKGQRAGKHWEAIELNNPHDNQSSHQHVSPFEKHTRKIKTAEFEQTCATTK